MTPGLTRRILDCPSKEELKRVGLLTAYGERPCMSKSELCSLWRDALQKENAGLPNLWCRDHDTGNHDQVAEARNPGSTKSCKVNIYS